MKIYNYFIEVSDAGIKRLIRFSVLAGSVQRANCAVSVAIVNSNLRTRNDGYALHHARLASVRERSTPYYAPVESAQEYRPFRTSRFIAQYDITYPYALLASNDCMYERRSFKRFITQRQYKAFLVRFHNAWKGIPSYAKNRGFKP